MPALRPMRVFAADVYLTVTIETERDDGEPGAGLHLHAGGQGVWIARMVRSLGEEVQLHASLGGETGQVVEHLLRTSGIEIRPVGRSTATQGYVHDRRSGSRVEVATVEPARLSRHELDDLYEDVLSAAADCEVFFLTGRAGRNTLSLSFYERLGADLASLGVTVIGDLHGEELECYLVSGRLALLKVSDEDLARDGHDTGDEDLRRWASGMAGAGVPKVVISRGDAPTLCWWDDAWRRATTPRMAVADHRGAGDSMTAALGVALSRELDVDAALALACGAGAASVTRHGLASVDARLVSEIASRVVVGAA